MKRHINFYRRYICLLSMLSILMAGCKKEEDDKFPIVFLNPTVEYTINSLLRNNTLHIMVNANPTSPTTEKWTDNFSYDYIFNLLLEYSYTTKSTGGTANYRIEQYFEFLDESKPGKLFIQTLESSDRPTDFYTLNIKYFLIYGEITVTLLNTGSSEGPSKSLTFPFEIYFRN